MQGYAVGIYAADGGRDFRLRIYCLELLSTVDRQRWSWFDWSASERFEPLQQGYRDRVVSWSL